MHPHGSLARTRPHAPLEVEALAWCIRGAAAAACWRLGLLLASRIARPQDLLVGDLRPPELREAWKAVFVVSQPDGSVLQRDSDVAVRT